MNERSMPSRAHDGLHFFLICIQLHLYVFTGNIMTYYVYSRILARAHACRYASARGCYNSLKFSLLKPVRFDLARPFFSIMIIGVTMISGRTDQYRLQADARVGELRGRVALNENLIQHRHAVSFDFKRPAGCGSDELISLGDLEDEDHLLVHGVAAASCIISAHAMASWIAVSPMDDMNSPERLQQTSVPHLHPNGIISLVPGFNTDLISLEVDSPPNTSLRQLHRSTCPSFQAHAIERYHSRGVVMQDGSVVYAPSDASRVLVVSPAGNSYRLLEPELQFGVKQKYEGAGALSPDGHAYFAPCRAEQFLRVAPDMSWTFIGTPISMPAGDKQRFNKGGVLAADGNIYFVPHGIAYIVRIRPGGIIEEVARIVDPPAWPRLLPPSATGEILHYDINQFEGSMYRRCVAVSAANHNGDIFAIVNNPDVIIIHISSDGSTRLLPESLRYHDGWIEDSFYATGVVNAEGDVVFAPYSYPTFMLITPERNIISFGPPCSPECQSFMAAGVLAADGALYFAPWAFDHCVRITDRWVFQTIELPTTQLPQPLFLVDGILDDEGNVIFAPVDGDALLRIWPAM